METAVAAHVVDRRPPQVVVVAVGRRPEALPPPVVREARQSVSHRHPRGARGKGSSGGGRGAGLTLPSAISHAVIFRAPPGREPYVGSTAAPAAPIPAQRDTHTRIRGQVPGNG